jgi:G6PDH family F420-dependent oxidoreductase
MIELGYALSSEEHTPNDLVRNAVRAEEAGFTFALISDHYHPWIDAQGHSPFVWSVIGGIAGATERLRLGTGVTCPIMRIHPAIIAQAAATSAAMMPGRFFLGVGTGENLNEHITAERWPAADERREMLVEALEIIRELWTGESSDYHGAWFRVENARLYTIPDEAPPIYVAASGERSAMLAAEIGDGLIATSPETQTLDAYAAADGDGPKYGQVTVCWDEDEESAVEMAHKIWPTSGVPGELTQELPLPRHFEQAATHVTKEHIREQIVCGPDARRHIEAITKFADAGYDHVYVHQIGPDQDGFFRFYEQEILPHVQQMTVQRAPRRKSA